MAARRGWGRAVEAVYERHREASVESDPLQFPRRFRARADREAAAFLAAALAFGKVRSVCSSLERIFAWTGARPARFCRELAAADGRERAATTRGLNGFRHRWITAGDVTRLGVVLGRMLAERGSLEAWFEPGIVRGRGGRVDLAASLESFREAALALDPRGPSSPRPAPPSRARPGPAYFFPSPRTSAAKRPAMFLRWMARRGDGFDLGLWGCLSPRDLVVPLDTHLFRIARRLRLTDRKTPGWPAAVDLTRALARLDPEDPVKYDFALSRLGIVEGCPRHSRTAPCELCRLLRE